MKDKNIGLPLHRDERNPPPPQIGMEGIGGAAADPPRDRVMLVLLRSDRPLNPGAPVEDEILHVPEPGMAVVEDEILLVPEPGMRRGIVATIASLLRHPERALDRDSPLVRGGGTKGSLLWRRSNLLLRLEFLRTMDEVEVSLQ
jgi:hypothetical protein